MMHIMQCAPHIVQTVKLLKFFIIFDQILRIFFENLLVSWGLRPLYQSSAHGPHETSVPQEPCVCPSVSTASPPAFKMSGSVAVRDLGLGLVMANRCPGLGSGPAGPDFRHSQKQALKRKGTARLAGRAAVALVSNSIRETNEWTDK